VPNDVGFGSRDRDRQRSTIQANLLAEFEQARNKGRQIATARLQQMMDWAADMTAHYQPQFDKKGKQKGGDFEQAMQCAELCVRAATALAPFQSPRLSAVQVIPPDFGADQDGKPRQTNVSVTIFNTRGEVEWSSAPKQIEGKVVP
jgi:hypothetical protein